MVIEALTKLICGTGELMSLAIPISGDEKIHDFFEEKRRARETTEDLAEEGSPFGSNSIYFFPKWSLYTAEYSFYAGKYVGVPYAIIKAIL